jgi:putative salt-induced outer membrane protein YdiY
MTSHGFDIFNCGRFSLTLSLLAIILLMCSTTEAKRKDLIVMKNGDRLTGEVKKLENGVLYVDFDYTSGSIGLDWLQVEEVKSIGGFQIVMKDGRRLTGTIEKVPADQTPDQDFEVHNPRGDTRAAAPDVVTIESQKSTFWRQLTGAIDFGYNFTSGNSQTSLTSDASANYLSTKWTAGASITTAFNGQSGGSKTNLLELQTIDGLFLSRNSIVMFLGDFLHSSQQDLNLRTTLGGGYGRYLKRTNHNSLVWIGGAVYTHENFVSGGQPAQQNVEALLGLQYQLFRFDRYGLQSQLLVYPGLSDAGRIRTTTKTTFTVKLVNKFHTDFSFWDNFDSRPPFDSKRNDLGISNSLGWTF